MVNKYFTAFMIVLLTSTAHAATTTEAIIHELQQQWAHANYAGDPKTQQQSFEHLMANADAVLKAHPDSTEILIWHGIIQSSYAGAKGGLGALSLAKGAREDFEQAIAIDPSALNGSAYTSLGILYAKVPGWPIGFGDDKKARTLLQKGLDLNPNGIDSNYFYGLYLLDNKQYQEAEKYLIKAMQAPARPHRALADSGRQQEIAEALATVKRKISSR